MKTETDAKTFKFRVIEVTYNNYLSYDEGRGSLSSVDATCHARVIAVWRDEPASFGEEVLRHGHPDLYLEEDSNDGYYEYSYTLERAEMGTDSWVWQGFLSRQRDDS